MEVHTTELLFKQRAYQWFCFMICTTSVDIRKTKIKICTLVYNNIVLRFNMLYLENYFRFCTISRMKDYLKEWSLKKDWMPTTWLVANGWAEAAPHAMLTESYRTSTLCTSIPHGSHKSFKPLQRKFWQIPHSVWCLFPIITWNIIWSCDRHVTVVMCQ